MDPTVLARRCAELKNKLRDELREEINEINGVGDVTRANLARAPRRNALSTSEKKPRTSDTIDYFELVYECIDTRINFLNVVSLNSRSPVDPDIDIAILQALLNGKNKTNINVILLKEISFVLQLLEVVIRVKQVVNENVNNFI